MCLEHSKMRNFRSIIWKNCRNATNSSEKVKMLKVQVETHFLICSVFGEMHVSDLKTSLARTFLNFSSWKELGSDLNARRRVVSC